MVAIITATHAPSTQCDSNFFETFPGLERAPADAPPAASSVTLDIEAATAARLRDYCATQQVSIHAPLLAIHVYALCRIYAGRHAATYVRAPGLAAGAALYSFAWHAGLSWGDLVRHVGCASVAPAAAPEPMKDGAAASARVLFLFNPDSAQQAAELAAPGPAFVVTLAAQPGSATMQLTLSVGGAVIAQSQLAYYAQAYRHLLQNLLAHPEAAIGVDDFHSPVERRRLLASLHGAHLPLDGMRNLPEMLAWNAQHHGDKTAFVFGGQTISFAQFHARVLKLAAGLAARGIARGDKVAVYSSRDIEWAVIQMACMAMGAVYVPVTPAFPKERIAQMLSQAEVKLVAVTDDIARAPVAALSDELGIGLATYAELTEGAGLDWNAVCQAHCQDDVAYIQFTSGTTGIPKGAMVEHLGMLNHLAAKIDVLKLTSADVIAQTASQCFDVSIWQLMIGLYTTSTTVIYPEDKIWDMVEYLAYTRQHAVTVLELVPSYLALLFNVMEHGVQRSLASLRYLMVTGERVTVGQVRQWFASYPQTPVINAYGPTEASDDVTHFIVEQAFEASRIPIGFPIRNTNVYILDTDLSLLPFGSIGEICVAGICVGRGYINRPVETARAFVFDPFQEMPVRMYRTGDFGRWLPDGSIEYFGRRDEQVKIMGVRIELTEIEQQLSVVPALKEVAVVFRNDKLICYYTSKTTLPVAPQEIRTLLKNSLPAHAIPGKFIHIQKMPLNKNDKIDKAKLL